MGKRSNGGHYGHHPSSSQQQQQQQELLPSRLKKKTSLEVSRLDLDTDIFLIQGLLSPAESRYIITSAESKGFEHQSSPGGPLYAYRNHYRQQVHSSKIAAQLWENTGLKDVFLETIMPNKQEYVVGLNPCIRLYKYGVGERFGKHIDDSCEVKEMNGKTEYTVLVYLSTVDDGGETVFYNERGRCVASVSPVEGLCLIHRHGEDVCLEHEALRVNKGIKYVLRSDIVCSSFCE